MDNDLSELYNSPKLAGCLEIAKSSFKGKPNEVDKYASQDEVVNQNPFSMAKGAH